MLEENRDARMAALAVSALWGPEPATLLWLVHGGHMTLEVQADLERALEKAGGIIPIYVDDPDGAKKFAVFAACRLAGFPGDYDVYRYASLAYGTSKSPHVRGDSVSQVRREELATQFIAAIRGNPG